MLLSTAVVTGQEEPAQEEPAQSLRIGLILPGPDAAEGTAGTLSNAVAESALMGATFAEEEFGFNAELLGLRLELLTVRADGADGAREAAEQLLAEEEVFALVGGFGAGSALALAELAEQREIPFLNIGSSGDRLRNEECGRYSFHVEPSAAMYLDALVGWFIRAGFRSWFFVIEDTPDGEALYERVRWSMRERHFGARETGRAIVASDEGFDGAIEAVRRNRADVVLLLLGPDRQLAFLEQAEAGGVEAQVTGFPHPAAQTREFFAASMEAAPVVGAGYRATSWEATLDAYGARELNARFAARWDTTMEPPAWSAYQAIKVLFETVSLGGAGTGPEVVEFLENPQSVFDIWKGIGVTFRSWDHQLRQSLYLVDLMPEAESRRELVTLVGELPAIYLPRTDPVERLDQLGDLRRESECDF
ncbi:MAG: ABC transporter substrate-binding protein [Trueperaceae bacterium]